MRLNGRKDVQSVKLAWSIYNQILDPTFYPLLRGVIKGVKETHSFGIAF